MKKTVAVFFLLLLCFASFGQGLAAEKVAWFKSGSNSRFWPVVETIMVAASRDLGIQLSIYEFKNDPFYMLQLVEEVLADTSSRPDCVLIHNYKKRGKEVLELSEKYGVPLFIFNAGFGSDAGVGQPRGQYPGWIGSMVPDDEYGGYLLAKELFARAKKMAKNSGGKIQMVALEGNRTSEASNLRVKGLKRALSEHPEVLNNQYFHSKWKVELAKEAFDATHRRYPLTTVYWTASENMALGVIEAASAKGLKPGEDFITGGFDLLPENKEHLENGKMSVSVGGHYFEGAWVLVLIHDYLKGIDFAQEGSLNLTSKMTKQTKDDFGKLNDIFNSLSPASLEALDFRILSKFYNSDLKKYDFDLDNFLKSAGK